MVEEQECDCLIEAYEELHRLATEVENLRALQEAMNDYLADLADEDEEV